jgi:NAD(P)-dependent dehydrogenase (short-subunit alcohol dehydrogenase family)
MPAAKAMKREHSTKEIWVSGSASVSARQRANRSTQMSAATVSNIANASGSGRAAHRAAPHRKNAAQRTTRSDSPYQERTSQKDNPTQALIRQAVDYLIQQLNAGQSDMLAAYLRTMARFHNYSFGNILQIARQRPTATRVAGYGKWKELGRFVKRGEKGIQILAPVTGFRRRNAESEKETESNLRGTFLVLAHAAQHISPRGRIIAFSSSVLTKSFPGYGAYIASKAGAEGLVHVLANELRGRNVTVNAVAPGPIATDLFTKDKTDDQVAQFVKMSPLERMGQPSDIASVVSFLAGPDGGWVNSQVLLANGGFAY